MDGAPVDADAVDVAAVDVGEAAVAPDGGSRPLDADWACDWVRGSAAVVAAHRAELSGLDRAIGDGDHGENLDRGFRAVLAKLDDASPETPGGVLKVVATTLISTVGGASGPLLGTAYLKAAQAAGDVGALDADAVVALLDAARDGIAARGKAQPGDKTMLDAWAPAAAAAEQAAASGAGPAAVLAAAAAAASAGAEATGPLEAHRGRASYLGERSVGHLDPGAVSSAYQLRAAADAAEG